MNIFLINIWIFLTLFIYYLYYRSPLCLTLQEPKTLWIGMGNNGIIISKLSILNSIWLFFLVFNSIFLSFILGQLFSFAPESNFKLKY